MVSVHFSFFSVKGDMIHLSMNKESLQSVFYWKSQNRIIVKIQEKTDWAYTNKKEKREKPNN